VALGDALMPRHLAAGINRDVNSIAATEALPTFLVLLVLSAVAGVLVARRRPERSAFEWFVAFGSIAPIVSTTLFRGEVSLGFDPSRLTDWSGSDLASLSRDPLSSSQFVLNVALFVPAGAVWTWLTRRAGRTLGALVLGSFVIECLQAVTGAGGNDLLDLVANFFGALLGVGGALIVINVAGGRLEELPRTKRIQLVVAGIVAVVLIAAGWFLGAARRQDDVRSTVVERFEDTDLTFIQTQLETNAEAVWGAVSGVRADYYATDDTVVLRFPAALFGLQRCVYATWTADEVAIRNASGDDCTRFLGG
jgi:hypothetical protein